VTNASRSFCEGAKGVEAGQACHGVLATVLTAVKPSIPRRHCA
jgi:hypothetical protein